jgi:hypothetical protein
MSGGGQLRLYSGIVTQIHRTPTAVANGSNRSISYRIAGNRKLFCFSRKVIRGLRFGLEDLRDSREWLGSVRGRYGRNNAGCLHLPVTFTYAPCQIAARTRDHDDIDMA